jgi:23S rRNA-/tRNA-specific pseudouridylate synthase
LVSLSLAFVATYQVESFQKQADCFLQRAENMNNKGPSVSLSLNSTLELDWTALDRQHGIQLIQETDEYLLLCKPSGMVCYHTNSSHKSQHNTKKRTREDTSLETCLIRNGITLSTLNKQGRGMVHRLDRGTSGVMVLAKTNRMHAILIAEFFLRRIEKSYQALVVRGNEESSLPLRGVIELDIDGRPAKSRFALQRALGRFARLKVKTEQGRNHQVRLHCAEGLKAPILLDPLYGGLAILSELQTQSLRRKQLSTVLANHRSEQKFCLHADSLDINRIGIQARAPLPEWWKSLEKELVQLE